jgi:hypothetical protein
MDHVRYRQQTRYPCCALVAAINARIHLGGPDVSDDEFERLVDLAACRHGAAIHISDAWTALGIAPRYLPMPHDAFPHEAVAAAVRSGHPVSVSIWHEAYGLHCVVCVHCDETGWTVLNTERCGGPRLTPDALAALVLRVPRHLRYVIAYDWAGR